MKTKIVAVYICSLFFLNCSNNQTEYQVQFRGALKNIMQRGDLTARISLDSLRERNNLYALGAIENLKGEILVFDGLPYIISVKDSALSMSHEFDIKASTLVYAQVQKWREFEVLEEINTYSELEKFVKHTAEAARLDTNRPFPFLLKGKSEFVEWHVIDWPEGDTIHTHQKHRQSGLHGRLENKSVEILGFYSDKHHGIFTHHSINMHLHVKTVSGDLAGHLDDIGIGEEMKLFLP